MFSVYILQCTDDSYYVGFTSNLDRRIADHNAGFGGRNTTLKRPVILLYHEEYESKMNAIQREAQLKKWSRAKKEALIQGDTKRLHDLSKRRKK